MDNSENKTQIDSSIDSFIKDLGLNIGLQDYIKGGVTPEILKQAEEEVKKESEEAAKVEIKARLVKVKERVKAMVEVEREFAKLRAEKMAEIEKEVEAIKELAGQTAADLAL